MPLEPTRQQLMLSRLTVLCFNAAEDLLTAQVAAETVEEKVRLAGAAQGAARSVRQCLAMEMKMVRFVRDLEKESPDFPARAREAREDAEAHRGAIRDRRTRVNEAIEPLIFNERDPDEARQLNHELQDWLKAAGERWDFTRVNFGELVAEACRRVGLDPADLDRWAQNDEVDLDDDEPLDPDDPDGWRRPLASVAAAARREAHGLPSDAMDSS